MNVGELIEKLKALDPAIPVWAYYYGSVEDRVCLYIETVLLTTAGNPATGRPSGDPDGPPSVILSDSTGGFDYRERTRQYALPRKRKWKCDLL